MIIDNICNSCSCTPEEAKEHLNSEIRNLRDLQDANDLRYNDFEDACKSLGLDCDYVPYFISAVAA